MTDSESNTFDLTTDDSTDENPYATIQAIADDHNHDPAALDLDCWVVCDGTEIPAQSVKHTAQTAGQPNCPWIEPRPSSRAEVDINGNQDGFGTLNEAFHNRETITLCYHIEGDDVSRTIKFDDDWMLIDIIHSYTTPEGMPAVSFKMQGQPQEDHATFSLHWTR